MPFRQLSVVPTVKEMDEALHHSRRAFDVPNDVPRPPLDATPESLLEGHFRLLRHDMLGSAFEQLGERNAKRQQMQRVSDTLYCVQPLQPNHQRGAEIAFGFGLHTDHPAWKKKSPKERGRLLKDDRAFKRGSLFMLRRGDHIHHIARMAETEEADLGAGVVNLILDDPMSLTAILAELTDVMAMSKRGRSLSKVPDSAAQAATRPPSDATTAGGSDQTYTAIAFASSFFSYEPVLQRLQRMEQVPFAEEFLRSPNPAATKMPDASYWPNKLTLRSLVDTCAQKKGLNGSQKSALSRGARKRVALIQGPPGTGKTYVGAALAELILQEGHQKILVRLLARLSVPTSLAFVGQIIRPLFSSFLHFFQVRKSVA